MNVRSIPRHLSALLLFLVLMPASLVFAAPVTIDATAYHVTILKEGKCEILYEITFTELESRDRIRTIGQFIEPMTFIESFGTSGGKRFGVTMESLGNGFYSAVFNLTTQTGGRYTVSMRYLVEKPLLDRTENNGIVYGKFWWSPVQWSLPIGKQTVQIMLPIEIAARYNRPEMITPAVVGPTGFIEDKESKESHQRWVYYPSQWKGKNYLSIHAEKTGLSAN